MAVEASLPAEAPALSAGRIGVLERWRFDISGITDEGSRLGLAMVFSVPLLGLLISVAATHTNVLVPQSDRPVYALGWLAGPFRYIGFTIPTPLAIALIILMFGAYVVAANISDRVSPKAVLGAVIAFNLIVLLGPPLFSTDIFSYQAYARMFTAYHTNPYTHGPSVLQLDPDNLYWFIGAKWIGTPSVYGPLFTLASGIIGGASVLLSAISFRLVAALSSAGVLFMLWRLAKIRNVNQSRAIAVFGLNPLITLYGVGGGHNDLLMLLFATAGIYFLLTRRELASGASIVAAAAIKLTGAVLLPFAFAEGAAGEGVSRRRRRFLIGAAVTTIVIAIPSFIVFGNGLLKMPNTLETVQDEGQWQSIPGFFLNLVGDNETHAILTGCGVILALVCLWMLRRVWRGQMDWLVAAGWTTFGLLLTAGSLLPWYVSWLFPIVALTSSRRLWNAAMWMTAIATVMTVVTYLPHGIPALNI